MSAYPKTIVTIINRKSQLKVLDISKISERLRKNARFILVINQEIYAQFATAAWNLYEKVYPVNVHAIDQVNILFDKNDLARIFADICNQYENLYALSCDEMNLETIEEVLAELPVSYWNKQTAKLCRDKNLMKLHMRKFGIRTPNFLIYNLNLNFEDLVSQLGLPFVLKPIDSGGSMGFYKIENVTEYENFKQNYKPQEVYQAEEFVTGKLYHIDSLVLENKQIIATVSEYLAPNAEFRKGKLISSLPLLESDPNYSTLLTFNQNVINSLDNGGSFHHEVFINQNNQPIFLEIAWRDSGPPGSDTFEYKYGVLPTLLHIIVLLGGPQEIKQISHQANYEQNFIVPKMLGTYNGLALPALSGKIAIEELIEHGTYISQDPESVLDACAKITLEYAGTLDEVYNQVKSDFLQLRDITISN